MSAARPIPAVRDLPAMTPPVAVVGDLHLCDEQPEVTARFLAWLAGQRGRLATLVLLGDVFDMWAGRAQQHEALPRRVIDGLRQVQKAGTRLAFLPGNRDLLFRGVDAADIELWPDPVRTRWGERTVLLTHGDQLCTADLGYQAMRRFFYGPWGRLGRLLFPYWLMRYLAGGLRRLSTRAIGRKQRAAMDIDYGAALAWMEEHGADLIVAGHVHTGVHHRHAGPPVREVLVLKDWEHGGSVVFFDEGGVRLEHPSVPHARSALE